MIAPAIGLPGVGFVRRAQHKVIFRQYNFESGLAGGRAIDGSKSRDPTNGTTPQFLLPGLLMGKITASGLYAPSIIGLATVAVAAGDTSVTMLAATATEIARRIGATGSIKLTGPPGANGTSRTRTLAYSAVGATTITIANPLQNEVQRLDFGAAATAGNISLQVPLPTGGLVTTANAAWSATDATYLSNIQTQLDAATGVTNGIVVSAIPAVDTDLGFIFTFSGTGYAGNTYPLIEVVTKPTSTTTVTVTRTTTGDSGAWVAGSFIQPTDGSETILSIIPDGYPRQVQDASGTDVTIPWPDIPIAGVIMASKVVNWPATDTSLKNYIRSSLDQAAGGGKFVFDDRY